MRKSLLPLLVASLALFALAGCQEEKKDLKTSTPIAVINQVDVYEKSTTITAAKEHLNATFEKLSHEMGVLTELAEKEKDKDKAKKMVEDGILDAQRRFEAEEQLITAKVSAVVEKTIKECREELGATIIISTDLLIDYDKAADISEMVIAKIDKQPISFEDPALNAADADKDATDAAGTTDAAGATGSSDAKADEKSGEASAKDNAGQTTPAPDAENGTKK